MASVFPHIMSGDTADKLNHKWMVLLLLLLSLVAFIVPLHPSFRENSLTSESSTKEKQSDSTPTKLSTHNVFCWCPERFTRSMVNYANTICTNGLLAALQGSNDTTVYANNFEEQIPHQIERRQPLRPVLKYRKTIQKIEKDETERQSVTFEVWSLATYRVPITLLVMAVVLVLPQAVWSLLSDLWAPFSLGPSIQAVSDRASSEEVSTALSSCFHSSPKTASVLFIVKKILSLLAAIVLLILITVHVSPEVTGLKDRLDSVTPVSDKQSAPGDDSNTTTTTTTSAVKISDLFRPPDNVFLCDMEIRRMTNSDRYTLQCSVSLASVNSDVDQLPRPSASANSSQRPGAGEHRLLGMEATILHIAASLMAILAVTNVLSLLDWICGLCCSSGRQALHLSGTASADLVLVVRLARMNCGINVARKLARESSDFNKLDQGEMSTMKS